VTLSKAPDKLYSFIEMSTFMRQLEQKASLDLLFQIEDELLKDPERGDLVPGTHGARKARIGDPKRRSGKRGGFRYIYLYMKYHSHIFLLFLYGKDEQGDLSPTQKKALAAVVDQIKEGLRNEDAG
jgi:hypothetical protein